MVTPHTGVWIETILDDTPDPLFNVTPHTGVWIETIKLHILKNLYLSHAPHGRVD